MTAVTADLTIAIACSLPRAWPIATRTSGWMMYTVNAWADSHLPRGPWWLKRSLKTTVSPMITLTAKADSQVAVTAVDSAPVVTCESGRSTTLTRAAMPNPSGPALAGRVMNQPRLKAMRPTTNMAAYCG